MIDSLVIDDDVNGRLRTRRIAVSKDDLFDALQETTEFSTFSIYGSLTSVILCGDEFLMSIDLVAARNEAIVASRESSIEDFLSGGLDHNSVDECDACDVMIHPYEPDEAIDETTGRRFRREQEACLDFVAQVAGTV